MARKGENIRKRKDGRWEGRYVVKENNISKMRSIYASSYTEVKKKLAKAKMENKVYDSTTSISVTLEDIAQKWLNEVYEVRKISTYVKYKSIYMNYIQKEIGALQISHISSEKIDNIYSAINSESCKKSIRSVLNQIFSYAQFHYQIPNIAMHKIKSSNKNENVKILTTSEQAKLIQYLYNDMDIYKFGILLCLNTGLRLGEICSLKWADIDFSTKSLHINRTVQRLSVEDARTKTMLVENQPKTNCSKREIPISNQIYKLLLKFKTTETIYFFNQNHPLDPRTYQYKFKRYLNNAGVDEYNFHILRHTFATNCISSGADVKSVSEILGHSDVKITLNRYVHPSMEVKRNHLNQLDSIYGQYRGSFL